MIAVIRVIIPAVAVMIVDINSSFILTNIQKSLVAQSEEYLNTNQEAVGSIPTETSEGQPSQPAPLLELARHA
jgi:hypothetical protein